MKTTILKMRYVLPIAVVLLTTLTIASCEKDNNGNNGSDKENNAGDVIKNWPATSKMVAEEVIAKYGQPNTVSNEMLIWYNNGPWKRTVLSRDTVQHNFPTPHPDLLEQVINYKVSPEKFDDMAMYDGSVILERTKGEMSARCDKEGANLLALNLANDVATGAKTTEAARAYYTQAMKTFKTTGQMDPYMMEFKFTVPTGGTNDPDMSTF